MNLQMAQWRSVVIQDRRSLEACSLHDTSAPSPVDSPVDSSERSLEACSLHDTSAPSPVDSPVDSSE